MHGQVKSHKRGKSAVRAHKRAYKNKVGKVMHEFKVGSLTTHGKTVTNRKQAIAIALSEGERHAAKQAVLKKLIKRRHSRTYDRNKEMEH